MLTGRVPSKYMRDGTSPYLSMNVGSGRMSGAYTSRGYRQPSVIMPLRTYGGLTGGSFRSTGRPRSAVPSGGFYETSVMSPTRTRKVKEYQHVEEYDTELDHYHTHKPVHRKRELHHHHVLHHRENVHHENHFHHIHRVRHRHHVHHNHHHHHQRHIDEVHHHHHDHHHHQLHHYHDVHHHQEEHQKEEVHHAHDHHHMDEKLHRREVHHEHHVPGTMSATRDVRHLTHAPREDPRVLTTYAGPQMRTSTTYPARRSLAAVSTEDHRAPLPVTLPTPGPSAGYAVASRRPQTASGLRASAPHGTSGGVQVTADGGWVEVACSATSSDVLEVTDPALIPAALSTQHGQRERPTRPQTANVHGRRSGNRVGTAKYLPLGVPTAR